MNHENNQLFDQFEKEVWLYLDGDLTEERMLFWKKKLVELPELTKIIDDYNIVSDTYNEVKEVELNGDNFNSMIDHAINKNSLSNKVKIFIEKLFSTDSEFAFGKIAFASALIVAAVVISFLSNRPNPIVNITSSINADLLEWDAEFVDNQISKVGNLLKVTKDDEYRKYYKYNRSAEKFDKNLNLINANIKTLKEEINSKKL